MAPATKLTPLTAEEQEKWDKDILEKVEALGIITCRERPCTFDFKENTKSHMPGERESIGEQAAKVARWDAKPIANDGDPIPLRFGLPSKWFDLNQPLPEIHQTSAPKVALLKNSPYLNPGKEAKIEGKKPMGEEEDVFVEVDLDEDEDYEMVENDEAEIAEWEQV